MNLLAHAPFAPAYAIHALLRHGRLTAGELFVELARRMVELGPRLGVLGPGERLALEARLTTQPAARVYQQPLLGLPLLLSAALSATSPRSVDPLELVVKRVEQCAGQLLGHSGAPPGCGEPSSPQAVSPWTHARLHGDGELGAAVAVAAGLAPAALASDTLGGARVPAAFCGLYAFRPSAWWSLRPNLALLARAPEDCLLLAEHLLVRPGAWAPASPPLRTLAELHVLVVSELAGARPSQPINELLQSVGYGLRHCGATVAHGSLLSGTVGHAVWRHRRRAPQLAVSRTWTPQGRAHLNIAARTRLRAVLHQVFRRFDLLVVPITLTASSAQEAVAPQGERIACTELPVLGGLPTITIPFGRPNRGEPLGVQLIGPPGSDERVIRAAVLIGRALYTYQPPPGW